MYFTTFLESHTLLSQFSILDLVEMSVARARVKGKAPLVFLPDVPPLAFAFPSPVACSSSQTEDEHLPWDGDFVTRHASCGRMQICGSLGFFIICVVEISYLILVRRIRFACEGPQLHSETAREQCYRCKVCRGLVMWIPAQSTLKHFGRLLRSGNHGKRKLSSWSNKFHFGLTTVQRLVNAASHPVGYVCLN
jgi:hypothetical protein